MLFHAQSIIDKTPCLYLIGILTIRRNTQSTVIAPYRVAPYGPERVAKRNDHAKAQRRNVKSKALEPIPPPPHYR